MANYKPDLSCQNKFIPIDFSRQILPDTFEFALSHIVDNRLDLSGFCKKCNTHNYPIENVDIYTFQSKFSLNFSLPQTYPNIED
jgi:hypothetical protein